MAPIFRVAHDKIEGEVLTLRDRSVLDDGEELLEVRDRAIAERQERKKNYQGVDFEADEAKQAGFDLDQQQAESVQDRRVPEEILVYQSEFQADDATKLKKAKPRKRKLEEPDETLDDYYVNILPKKLKVDTTMAAVQMVVPQQKTEEPHSNTAVEPQNSQVVETRKSANLDWLETLPEVQEEPEVPQQTEHELPEYVEISAGKGSAVLQEEPLDESASSFIRLLRRRGLLGQDDGDFVFQDKRGREFKGKDVFKEISRRFRGGRGGMKQKI
jgi:hypothetical protein